MHGSEAIRHTGAENTTSMKIGYIAIIGALAFGLISWLSLDRRSASAGDGTPNSGAPQTFSVASEGGSDDVEGRARPGGSADSRWHDAADQIMAAVAHLPEVDVELSDSEVSIVGRAPSKRQRDEALSKVRSALPYGVLLKTDLKAPLSVAGAQCQQEFSRVLDSARISFMADTSTLFRASHEILDELATIAQRCPDANLEIAAHTDSDGSAAANLLLSRERGTVIVNQLTKRGVARSRLSAVGYGERMPLADNGTQEGRALNRRVEVIVRGE